MIGFIIWIIGLVLTIKAGMEIRKTNCEVVKKTSVHRLNHHYKLVWAGFLLFLCQGQASRMDEINHEGDVLSLLLIYCFL